MELDEREKIIELYDLYSGLLTDKQREYFEDYYFSDLSISEIASNYSISRNGVHDQLKRVVQNLNSIEEAVGLNKKIQAVMALDIEDDIKERIISLLKE